jgi:glycosyltransferase involved in cell wall biosynthesis
MSLLRHLVTGSQNRQTLLVVAPFVPEFDRLAGSLRFFTMLRILSRDYHIIFQGAVKAGGERYVAALTSLGVEFHDSTFTNVETLLPRVQVGVFFEFYYAAEGILDVVRLVRRDLPIIVDSVDLHFVRQARAAAYAESPEVAERRALDTRQRELDVYRRADAVIVVTETDKRTLLDCLPDSRIAVVPTIHQEATVVPRFHDRRRNSLLFVGGFEHSPNVDAVLFFSREILPRIRKSVPDVIVTIVGDAPPAEVRGLASDTVRVTGWVPEVKPYLDSHVVSIAPLRFGSGMKGKVGEAMANGLPVVVTRIAAEGMELGDGDTALIADAADEFAGAVIRLLRDQDLHHRLSTNGRWAARTRWSEAVVGEQVLALMKTLPELAPKGIGVQRRVLWVARILLRRLGVGRLRRRLQSLVGGPSKYLFGISHEVSKVSDRKKCQGGPAAEHADDQQSRD